LLLAELFYQFSLGYALRSPHRPRPRFVAGSLQDSLGQLLCPPTPTERSLEIPGAPQPLGRNNVPYLDDLPRPRSSFSGLTTLDPRLSRPDNNIPAPGYPYFSAPNPKSFIPPNSNYLPPPPPPMDVYTGMSPPMTRHGLAPSPRSTSNHFGPRMNATPRQSFVHQSKGMLPIRRESFQDVGYDEDFGLLGRQENNADTRMGEHLDSYMHYFPPFQGDNGSRPPILPRSEF
jgi:hypothetical protein